MVWIRSLSDSSGTFYYNYVAQVRQDEAIYYGSFYLEQYNVTNACCGQS